MVVAQSGPWLLPHGLFGLGAARPRGRVGRYGLGDDLFDSSGVYIGPGMSPDVGILPGDLTGYGNMSTQSSSQPGFWESLLAGGVKAGENIATARFAVPPPGTLIKTPTSMIYTQPNNPQSANLLTSVGGSLLTGGTSITSLLVLGVVAIVVMKAIK
jgi:hypothetical protein